MEMRLRALAAISTSFVVSCSALASFDGLAGDSASSDGGPGPGASADGTTGADSATRGDANTSPDSNTGNDAGAGGEASSDAGRDSGGDAAMTTDGTTPLGFCAKNPSHTFCDDFDEVPLATNWTKEVHNGSVALDTISFTSPPYGVVAASPTPDAGTDTVNDIVHNLNSGTTISAEAAFKVEGSTQGCDFIAISFDTGQTPYTNCYLDLSYDSINGVIVEAECGGGTMPMFYQMTSLVASRPNSSRFSLTVDLGAATVTGVNGATTESVPLPSALAIKGPWALGVGVLYNALDGTCTVHVDDVTVDTK
jgi:hypothetical protein